MSRIFSIASGKRWVSLLGLLLTAVGFLCLERHAELEAVFSVEWTTRICSGVTLLGGLLASLGKGIGDQRQYVRKNSYVKSEESKT
jgi:hypothetical protein